MANLRTAGRETARALAIASAFATWGAAARADEAADDVVVRGSRTAPAPASRNDGVAVGVVGRERLVAPGLRAADVLRGQPGVAAVDTGGAGALSTASIRGATSAQTPVYLAGVRLNDDVAGTADLSLVPLWLVERAEIYRGDAPTEADRLGIGGAIFFDPLRPRGARVDGGVLAGSFGTRGAFGWAAAGDEDASALVAARFERATNDYAYLDDRGTLYDGSDDVATKRSNADARTVDAWAIGSQALGDEGRADVVVQHVERAQGMPGLALLPTRASRAALARTVVGVRARVPCDAALRCSLETSTGVVAATSTFDDPLREVGLGTSHLEQRGTRVEQGVAVALSPALGVRLEPSLRVASERLVLAPRDEPDASAARTFSRAALSARAELGRGVVAHAVASAECHGTSSAGARACDTAAPSGRAGVAWSRGALTLLANLGRYARVPTLGELYGVSGAVRGSVDLVPEHGTTGELGARLGGAPFRGADAYAEAFAFATYSDDLVAYRRAALGYVRPYNVGAARVLGVEALARLSPVRPLLLELSATALDPRDTSTGHVGANDVLPYRSRLVVAPRVELRTRAVGAIGLSSLRVDARWVRESSRYADAAGLVVIPAQTTLDTELEARALDDRVAARARVSNWLDAPRYDVVGYPLPGRALYLSIEVTGP